MGVIFACLDAVADGHDEPVGPNPEYLYLAVDDLDAFEARVGELGFQRFSEIRTHPWGERSIYTTDPFGNPICFVDTATCFTGGVRFD